MAEGPVIVWPEVFSVDVVRRSTMRRSRAALKEVVSHQSRRSRCDQRSVLLRRYREVAAEMAPYRQRTVFEVHPELSFFQLNGDVPLRWTKKFEVGSGGAPCAPDQEDARASIARWSANWTMFHWRTSSMRAHCCGRLEGYSPRAEHAFRQIPNGMTRDCGWRSSASCGRDDGDRRLRSRDQAHSASWLDRPLSNRGCALGWLVATIEFVGLTRILGGPTQARCIAVRTVDMGHCSWGPCVRLPICACSWSSASLPGGVGSIGMVPSSWPCVCRFPRLRRSVRIVRMRVMQ